MARSPAAAPPGSSLPAPASAPAPTPATAAEAAIASRIPAVLADEEATDDAPGIDPSMPGTAARVPNAPVAAGPATGVKTPLWKWALWAALVLVIAIFARTGLRSGGAGPSVR